MNYTPEQLDEILAADEVETNESLLENIHSQQYFTAMHTRLVHDLVDCEPSIY